MKTKLTKLIICIFAITFAITGCSKDEDIISASANNKQDILTFATIAEFNETLQKVNSMNSAERMAWEKERNFKSFGTICNEFYKTIDYESFTSISEVKSFVANNSEKIKLCKNIDGELSCVTQEFDNPERYVMNENWMYIIGNKAYRVFPENKKVSCDLESISELASVKDFSEITKSVCNFFEITERLNAKSSTNSGDQYFERTEKKSIGSKNYQTIVRIEAVTLFWSSLGMPGNISYAIWYRIQNQSQFIVWWYTDASTKYAPFSYKISNGYDNFTGKLYDPFYWQTGTESFTKTDDDIKGYIGEYPYHEPQQSTASPYIVTFEGFVYSTFTKSTGEKTTITVNLKYPY